MEQDKYIYPVNGFGPIGYGFSLESLTNISFAKDLFKQADFSNLLKEEDYQDHSYVNAKTIGEVIAWYNDRVPEGNGAQVIADWMTNHAEINPRGLEFNGYEQFVYYGAGLPWWFPEDEKNLTEHGLRRVLEKFYELLK